ncbi:MAG: TIGR03808 family TAT-translocated repetitive protein [Alphaproteobacteria bacterium]|nr:TIGR03808 family TAT-translocated repetitive protein [Alphaproteobacteria bacterium]
MTGIGRRNFLALAGGLALVAAATPTRAAEIDAGAYGIVPNSTADQTDALQAGIDATAVEGKPLMLEAGRYQVRQLSLRSGVVIEGVGGATVLVAQTSEPVLYGDGIENVRLAGLAVDGQGGGSADGFSGLLRIMDCGNLDIESCLFANGSGNGVFLSACSGRIANCTATGFGQTALFANDSKGLVITGNRIADCGNGGIRVFRGVPGEDGTIVTENVISDIRSGSGNGQNGNAINVFRADGVIVANNVASDVDFSAVRLNSTKNCVVRGNVASLSREVAIFSEFAFSGSIIAENIIDGAATGISITNFNDGGRLAVCQGNIVRNIYPASPTNPDTRPVGIFAEADTAIIGNVVEAVPGIGIAAGWGQYLRDVLISGNVIRETEYAVAVSVAPGAGTARVANNLISGARTRAISGFAWAEPQGGDLSADPAQFETVAVEGNTIS